MSKYIVTGNAGFMGSHLVHHLINRGHKVVGIDNLSTGFRTNIHAEVETHYLDLVRNADAVSRLVESYKPDAVFHLAAWAHEGLSQFSPIKVTENNYNATLNILIPSIKVGAKFIFTSSMSVYGKGQPPFDETHERKPVDIYGVAKTASESAIEILSQVHNFNYTILRPHNVYGPGQSLSDPYRNVVGIFMRRAIQKQPLIVYGDGEQKRAFSYIDDITPAIANAAWDTKSDRQIINIGPKEEHTINELSFNIKDISPNTIDIEHIPDRPMEVKDAWCTNTKAVELLGYETKTSFRDGLEKMWNWAVELDRTSGIRQPIYLDNLELVSSTTPKTWTQKSL